MKLGTNLYYAVVIDESGRRRVVLDGRENKNPAARVRVPPGTYVLEKKDGTAPGDVDYYGHPL
jgi:hypothetical protein